MGVLTINSCMASTRAVATEAYAKAVVNRMAGLTTPHAFFGVACSFLHDTIPN